MTFSSESSISGSMIMLNKSCIIIIIIIRLTELCSSVGNMIRVNLIVLT